MTTYECEICYGINSVSRMACKACGTIPKIWSLTKQPARLLDESIGDCINGLIPVVAAIGVDRQERHRTCKRVLRTVPADYYASE